MSKTLAIPQLLEEWLLWAKWVSNPNRREEDAQNFIGWGEFDWMIQQEPEQGWEAILVVAKDPRSEMHLGTLAAGPLEDLLSKHGELFIDRVEREARSNPRFAYLLGGVWRSGMTDEVWNRVQQVWDRRGWDGIPKDDA